MSCELPAAGTGTDKIVVARKDYKCCECQKVIKKGKRYRCFTACWPGVSGWDSFRSCLRCGNLLDLALEKYPVPPNYPEDYPAFGELFEYIRESRR